MRSSTLYVCIVCIQCIMASLKYSCFGLWQTCFGVVSIASVTNLNWHLLSWKSDWWPSLISMTLLFCFSVCIHCTTCNTLKWKSEESLGLLISWVHARWRRGGSICLNRYLLGLKTISLQVKQNSFDQACECFEYWPSLEHSNGIPQLNLGSSYY